MNGSPNEQPSFEAVAASKKEEEQEKKLLQQPTILVVGLALALVLLLGLILPIRDSLSLNSWLGRAAKEAAALAGEIPADLRFTAAEYDAGDRSLVLYDYIVRDPDPIPARTEVGRAALDADARLNTFVDARRLGDGVLFARKKTFASDGSTNWDGLYVGPSGLGALEEYLLREAGEGIWYLGGVPESVR